MNAISRFTSSRFTSVLPGLAIIIFLAGYLVMAWQRVAYPYDLEFIEDGILMQSLRMSQGLPVYLPPNAEFVPHAYPVLYPWLGSLFYHLVEPGFAPLRLLSLAAALAAAALLYAIARREGASRLLAAGCVLLFLAGDRVAGGWYTLARVDSLFLLLVLAGMVLAVYGRRSPFRLVGAALLFALSMFAKQQGLAFALVAGFYLVLVRGLRAWVYFATLAVAALVPTLLLQAATGGWYLTYVFGIQAGSSELQPLRALYTLIMDFGGAMGVLVLAYGLAAVVAWRRRGWRLLAARPWLLFTLAAIAVAVLGRTSVGGNLNHLMPAYALLCLAPVWAARLLPQQGESRAVGRMLLWGGIALQVALTFFNPLRALSGYALPLQMAPSSAMRAAGERLIARIAATEGEVLVLMHPYYAVMAGKAPAVQIPALWHARGRGEQPLPADLVARIEQERYALIISDESDYFETEPALLDLIERHYRRVEDLPPALSPPTISGMLVRPRVLYAPRSLP